MDFVLRIAEFLIKALGSPLGAWAVNQFVIFPELMRAWEANTLKQEGDLAAGFAALDNLDLLPDEVFKVVGPLQEQVKNFLSPEASNTRFNMAFDPITGGLDALPGQFAQGAAANNQFAAGRTQQGLALLEGQGEQSRTDINRRFDELGGNINQDLISRGLRGTSIAPTLDLAVERERSSALGGLDEALRQQQLNTFTSLSGDELTNRQDQLGQGTNLSFNVLGAQGNIAGRGIDFQTANFEKSIGLQTDLGLLPLQARSDAIKNRVAFINRIDRVPPPSSGGIQVQP